VLRMDISVGERSYGVLGSCRGQQSLGCVWRGAWGGCGWRLEQAGWGSLLCASCCGGGTDQERREENPTAPRVALPSGAARRPTAVPLSAASHGEGGCGCSFSHPPAAPSSCPPPLRPQPEAEQPRITHAGDVAALGVKALPRSWANVTAVSPAASAPQVPAGCWGLGLSAGTQLIRSSQ